MTDSSQQEFFLDQFQEVRDLLEGGEVKSALGLMLDVRESGFVNKELDAMIDALRDDPPQETVDEAHRWSQVIIERLQSYGGDVFQLVEEFSEASLGFSEAEWVPVDSSQGSQADDAADDILAMDFDDFDEMGFDVDIDFEDAGDEAGDFALDFDDELEDFDDFEELDAFGEESSAAQLAEEEADEDPPSVDFALVDGVSEVEGDEGEMPAEMSRDEQATKPNPSVDSDHHSFVEEATRRTDPLADMLAHQSVMEGKAKASEAASADSSEPEDVPEPAADAADDADDEFDFDFGFENPAAKVETPQAFEPEPVQPSSGFEEAEEEDDEFDFDLGFENPAAKVETPQASEPEPAQPTSGFEEAEEEDDEFDFDLGFENPAAKVETPQASEPEPAQPTSGFEEAEEEDDDEFDFDLGFENPAARVETPQTSEPEPAQPSSGFDEADEEEDDELDFDLGFSNPESKNETPIPGRLSGGRLEDSQELNFDLSEVEQDGGGTPRLAEQTAAGRESHRDPEVTPPSMPSIPRFRSPADEETNPRNKPSDSLDDDEFFELAESLSSDSSDSQSQSGPYRGEPLMNTPVPSSSQTPVPSGVAELSELSEPRERANTPNPFAHEAPTGVQQALVDSHSSFVLEEIRESEVSDASDDDAAVGALMGEARRLYEKGRFESAHDLLEAVLDRESGGDQANELMNAVEGELERQYQARLGSLSKVPRLEVSMADIPNMNLDHRFGYLLSQIDGMSTFEDILELSSMTRLETLEVLAEMLDRDIIGVS
ncbi:hypothetical protein FIV42_26555 [Persicimonas caeni]|uniref:Uncharacterized protein n=1 Tax=Persicimonas caeni TaxID=2292766 RepID=A0A4Y6Q0S2_PERCE|nr:hypothetical protein [Persicimonas caeni]QDG54174.1 hypothetical protein FIV42_26555 [Persicimonas caeni]QED35395.1 hypothetical protein FRD00_26550 [Persicimonas caeni]